VNLIDLSKLDPENVDSSLKDYVRERQQQAQAEPKKRRLLINIDYAFGRQAGDVLCCLILLFGDAIRSVNVLGKAGSSSSTRVLLPFPAKTLTNAATGRLSRRTAGEARRHHPGDPSHPPGGRLCHRDPQRGHLGPEPALSRRRP
jgi:hypothetical protein